MKQILLSTFCAVALLPTAAEYRVMQFDMADGSSISVAAEGLVITPVGSQLVITNASGEKMELTAAGVATMQFADPSTGMATVTRVTEGAVEVYGIAGEYSGHFESAAQAAESLEPGIYILRSESGEAIKIRVEK